MISKDELQGFVEGLLLNTDYFLTGLTVSSDNDIVVEVDSFGPVDVDFCGALSRRIEEAFPRDEEDYTLEVGSAGITSPFKVRKQWEKNIGNDIEVVMKGGKKLKGKLVGLKDEYFVLEQEAKVKVAGVKKPAIRRIETELPLAEVKRASYDLKF